MNTDHWEVLLRVIDGEQLDRLPVGLIIDSPWLPGWYGISTLDYYCDNQLWFDANSRAIAAFPEVMFLPGFWSEYGMCTEPSAFGAKCRWEEASLPHAGKISGDLDVLCALPKPDVRKDGLLPFMLCRLKHMQPQIESMGHEIKFAVARGPLNIASFLMGTTELMMAMIEDPDRLHRFVGAVSDFLTDWIGLQMEQFPSIEGILLLDDIIGFVGDEQCREYVVPYFKKIFGAFNAKVNFLHNDAAGLVSAPYLPEMGVNLFNHSHKHSLAEMKHLTANKVALVGNIPPRDVLALGTPEEVRDCVRQSVEGLEDWSRLLISCGGGVPQGVPTDNIHALVDTVATLGS